MHEDGKTLCARGRSHIELGPEIGRRRAERGREKESADHSFLSL